MLNNVDALKNFVVTIANALKDTDLTVDDIKGETIVDVLKELAVALEIEDDVEKINLNRTSELLNYIAENYEVENETDD